MQVPVQITVRHMPHSAAFDEDIQLRAARLERYFSPITACRVVAQAPDKRHRHGGQFMVRVDVTVPGTEIVVEQEHENDIYVALHAAFNAARRRLEAYARIRRGETRLRQAAARRRRSSSIAVPADAME